MKYWSKSECQQRLADERALSAALSALAAKSTEAPSPVLEDILRGAFRRQTATKSASTTKRFVAGIGFAAAAAFLVAAAWIGTRAEKPVIGSQPKLSGQQRSSPTVESVSSAPATSQIIEPAGAGARVNRQAIHQPSAHPASSQVGETTTEFIRLPYTDPLLPTEQANIFRVQMPEAALAAYGLPVDGSHLDSRIDADLVVGQDGVPRAIRFIR